MAQQGWMPGLLQCSGMCEEKIEIIRCIDVVPDRNQAEREALRQFQRLGKHLFGSPINSLKYRFVGIGEPHEIVPSVHSGAQHDLVLSEQFQGFFDITWGEGGQIRAQNDDPGGILRKALKGGVAHSLAQITACLRQQVPLRASDRADLRFGIGWCVREDPAVHWEALGALQAVLDKRTVDFSGLLRRVAGLEAGLDRARGWILGKEDYISATTR